MPFRHQTNCQSTEEYGINPVAVSETGKNAPAEQPDEWKVCGTQKDIRKGWQKLLRAGSHTPASQLITEVKVSVKLSVEAVMRSSVRCLCDVAVTCEHAGVSA